MSTPSNSPTGTGQYVGWNGATGTPLEVRHNGNQHIQWYTDSIQRMQLYNSLPAGLIATDTADLSGFLALSGNPAFFNTERAFTRLHLADNHPAGVINAQQFGFRDWQRNGVTFTGNADHGYLGQKFGGRDTTDMVLLWSNDAGLGAFAPDHLSFRFGTSLDRSRVSGARSEEGLEGMRLFPLNDSSIHVGVGDFWRATVANGGVVQEPTERLHVNDGTIRIDSLVPDYRNDTLTRVMMTDGNGRVHWRPISTWPQNPAPGADCDWETLAATRKVVTAWRNPGSNGSCPDRRWRLGIGRADPEYKLDIYHTEDDEGATGGIRSIFRGDAASSWRYGLLTSVAPKDGSSYVHSAYGVQSSLTDVGGTNGQSVACALVGTSTLSRNLPIAQNTGVYGKTTASAGTVYQMRGGEFRTEVTGAAANFVSGVEADVTSSGAGTIAIATGVSSSVTGTGTNIGKGVSAYMVGAQTNYGVDAYVIGSGTTNYGVLSRVSGAATTTYGVKAEASGATTNYAVHGYAPGEADWAGYFVGRSYTTDDIWTPSDEGLKLNVEPLGSAMERLMRLDPKTYVFDHGSYPHMGLPREQRYGFLAQELAGVFPEFVTDALHPATLDSLGAVIHPAVAFKAVSLAGLTPVIVAAMKEQNTLIEELRSELAQLREQVNACCSNPDGSRIWQDPADGTAPVLDGTTGDRKLRIVPNPFNERTTVYYALDHGGRAQLLANSADGKELRVLQEAVLESGDYQFQWNTASLAPGMYYVTLLLDGQPVVKKAVKVDR